MIRIVRSNPAPNVLANEGAAATRANARKVRRDSADYGSGKRKLVFDRTIYGHPEVKERLIAMQHGKCAFCEAQVTHISDGDVEHFRPKGRVRQSRTGKRFYPGYWWLAYDWSNLILACIKCNQRNKGDLFPLGDAEQRARVPGSHFEQPLFIDPAELVTDPEQLIGWHRWMPIAAKGNRAAKTTIKELSLKRKPLVEHRRAKYRTLQKLWNAMEGLKQCGGSSPAQAAKAAEIAAHFSELTNANAEYAGMVRAAVKIGFAR